MSAYWRPTPMPSTSLNSAEEPLARYCRGCGYSLRGLSAGKCPECGRPFDPANEATLSRRKPRRHLRRCMRRSLFALLFLTLATVSVPLYYWWSWRTEQRTIHDLQQIGASVDVLRADPEGVAKLLPKRWAFLSDYAQLVDLRNSTAAEIDPVDLRPLARLRGLRISKSGIGDAALAKLRACRALRSLMLMDNPIDGSGLAYLSDCRELLELNLRRTRVSDSGLANVGKLVSLQVLDLEGTAVTDAGIDHLSTLTNLQQLYLGDTSVTDVGLLKLRVLKSLNYVQTGHRITDQGKKELTRCLPNITIE